MQPFCMLQLARSVRVVAVALPLLAGAGCGGGKSEQPSKTPATTAGRLVPASSEGRCAVRISPDKKLTEITSQQDGYGLLLPGSTWDIQCNDEHILFASSDLLLHVSVVEGDPTQMNPEQYLRNIYERSATQLEAHGWEAAAPRVAEVKSPAIPTYTRLALFHEVIGVEAEGQPMKSIHGWTSMRTKNDVPLDYHVSWTGPEEAWQDGMLDGLGVMLLSFGPLEAR